MADLFRSNSTDSDLELLYTDNDRQRQRRFKNFLGGVFVGFVCFVSIIALIITARRRFGRGAEEPAIVINASPIINTTCGFVQGKQEDGVFIFRGIPYAAPPLGPLRWMPPEANQDHQKCSPGIFRAFNFGPKCYQFNENHGHGEGSEDCLFINVWTPRLGEDIQLDVMVYIHGGGLVQGSGNDPGATPTAELAIAGNMVFVSFNYRLSVFGFLALPSMVTRSSQVGNYGYMDQVMALRWVQDNIHQFGGNPNKVTVFGHEAGGGSIQALLAAPSAQGLFQKAWIMSGLQRFNATPAQVHQDHMLFVNHTGCKYSSMRQARTCLRKLKPEQILNAVPWDVYPSWDRLQLWDVPARNEKMGAIGLVDGSFLPSSSSDDVSGNIVNDVAILIGSMAQAADERPTPDNVTKWTWQDYDWYLSAKLDTYQTNFSSQAISHYPHLVALPPRYQFVTMVTDLRITCPTNKMAASLAASLVSPVYRYVVTSMPSTPIVHNGEVKKYAYNSWDILTFFGTTARFVDSPTKKDMQMTAAIRKLAFDFVRGEETTRWHTYPRSMALVSDETEFVAHYHDQQCRFWNSSPLYPDQVWKS